MVFRKVLWLYTFSFKLQSLSDKKYKYGGRLD